MNKRDWYNLKRITNTLQIRSLYELQTSWVMNIQNLLVDGGSIFDKELLKGNSVLALQGNSFLNLFNSRTEKVKRSI